MGRRGRPRLHPSTSGRSPANEIVDAAIRLIEQHGLAGLTVSALADELKVARTVVYHHFGDIDAVIAEVGTRVLGPLFEVLDRLEAAELPQADMLRSYMEAETRLLATTPVPVEAILNNPRLADTSHSPLWESLAELQQRLTDSLVAATDSCPADASMRLLAASAMTIGMRVLSPEPSEDAIQQLITLQLEVLGLAAPRGS